MRQRGTPAPTPDPVRDMGDFTNHLVGVEYRFRKRRELFRRQDLGSVDAWARLGVINRGGHPSRSKDQGCRKHRNGAEECSAAGHTQLPVPGVAGVIMMCAPAVPGNISQGAPGAVGWAERPVDSVVAQGV